MARILVADDETSIREMIKLACELDNHDVCPVADAEAALAAYETFKPELMILDVNMPGGGGDHVLEQLRVRLQKDPCPWIVVTGIAGVLDDEERARFRAVAVLSKPFSIDSLRMAVKTALS